MIIKKKTIKVPIYFGKLIIMQAGDSKSYVQAVDKYNLGSKAKSYDAVAWRPKNGRYLILFDHGKWAPTPSIIAHECLHILGYIFADGGVKYDLDNDEPAAYLIEWITSQCFLFVKTRKEYKL